MSERHGGCRAGVSRLRMLGVVLLGAVGALGLFGMTPASAARHWQRAEASTWAPVFEWIVLDAETGRVLGEQNADAITYPASLTKMMTLYLTFEALNQGRITLDTRFAVSEHSATRAPSKLGLEPGDSVSVRSLILAIVTKSANDAATVLAEGLAGSEENFARYMNWKARQLGMDHTYYDNASGLPDPLQRTCARDIARLALALYQHFPREYRYFSIKEFDFRGQTVRGHDHLLDWYPGADGIKTGFINASGFNLATSAVRDGRRLIGVVMGGRTARVRDMQMASLLDQGFAILASGRPAPAQSTTLVATAAPPVQPPSQPKFPAPLPAGQPRFPAPAAVTAAPAATPVATAPPVAARPIAAAAAPAAVPTPAVATARTAAQPAKPADEEADADDTGDRRSGLLNAALKHLAPVAKAEAATLARPERDGDDWAIQVGAFRAAGAATHAAREVAHLAIARGKPEQVIAPARYERDRLYRARFLHFTQRSAEAACAELHRRRISCSVVRGSLRG